MKLENSISILKYFATKSAKRAQIILKTHKKLELKENDEYEIILESLIHKNVIDSVSYLDEYHQVFGIKTENKFKERIKQVKIINKHVTQRIKKWKDLSLMRNQLLAHNLRIGKNGKYLFESKESNFNAPRTIFDIALLSNLIQIITITVCEEFESEMLNEINNEGIDYLSLNEFNLKNEESVSEESLNLLKKTRNLSLDFNKEYNYRT